MIRKIIIMSFKTQQLTVTFLNRVEFRLEINLQTIVTMDDTSNVMTSSHKAKKFSYLSSLSVHSFVSMWIPNIVKKKEKEGRTKSFFMTTHSLINGPKKISRVLNFQRCSFTWSFFTLSISRLFWNCWCHFKWQQTSLSTKKVNVEWSFEFGS